MTHIISNFQRSKSKSCSNASTISRMWRTMIRQTLYATVARAFNVPFVAVCHSQRSLAPVAQARQMAMYLAQRAYGLPFSVLGATFGRDRTTVRHACTRVEALCSQVALCYALNRLADAMTQFMDVALGDDAGAQVLA
jgi:chromosomal replication initiation ATPase DnaA